MKKPWSNIETNTTKIVKALTKHGPRNKTEIRGYTGLLQGQCTQAIKTLVMGRLIELKGELYQVSASKYAPYMVSRLWDKAVFAPL